MPGGGSNNRLRKLGSKAS